MAAQVRPTIAIPATHDRTVMIPTGTGRARLIR
jgi:hypothetical protein